ncbi:MAG: hypothetical protein RL173_87 [Fibrobacterota bacterium]|jgi:hypothetical protein
MNTSSRTLAVAVLRGVDWNDAPVAKSLASSGSTIPVAVYSNGKSGLPPVGGHVEESLDDGRNPGVGPRYLQAARLADERGDSFLLLLDHDFTAPDGWWTAYEAAVSAHPLATCWAPRLVHDGKRLSPFVVKCGTPRRGAPIGSGPWDATGIVALNSGLLIRVDALLSASRELTQAPLDFSDYSLFHRMGRSGGTLALVDLELVHDLSSHAPASVENRLARFAWFCAGARAYADLDPVHRRNLRRWSLGRALKLAAFLMDRRFLSTWTKHFAKGLPLEPAP